MCHTGKFGLLIDVICDLAQAITAYIDIYIHSEHLMSPIFVASMKLIQTAELRGTISGGSVSHKIITCNIRISNSIRLNCKLAIMEINYILTS